MGSERLQGLSNTATHQCGLVCIDMLTQGAGQVVGMSEHNMPIILRRICFGYWNNIATVRAVDCDVPLVGLNGFSHRLPQMMSTLQRCIEPRLARLSQPLLGASNQLQYPVGVWPSHRFLPKPPRRWMAGLPWARPMCDCAHLLCRKGGGGSRSLSVG